jgi:hypothetical protein
MREERPPLETYELVCGRFLHVRSQQATWEEQEYIIIIDCSP